MPFWSVAPPPMYSVRADGSSRYWPPLGFRPAERMVSAVQTSKRQKRSGTAFPDALDLIIVCLEAGSSLDQAIVKASDELDIAYPALADELRTDDHGNARRKAPAGGVQEFRVAYGGRRREIACLDAGSDR